MKFSEFKEKVLNKVGRDEDHVRAFNYVFESYNDNDYVGLTKLKDYIEHEKEYTSETADDLTDIYDDKLLDWYQENHSRILYMDEASAELGSTGSSILAGGQYLYWEEVVNEIIYISLNEIEILEEQE
jgi:hypothetical protein